MIEDMRRLLIATVSLGLLPAVIAAVGHANSPWGQVGGKHVRATSDRDADLIDALVRAGRFDDAASLCEARLRKENPESDAYAKWTIRQSQIMTARQMESNSFDESEIEGAQHPTTVLLRGYPDHRRVLFLQAQKLAVRRQAAIHRVLRAAVTPSDNALKDAAFKRLLRTSTAVESLADQVGDRRSRIQSQPDAHDFAFVTDLTRLQQELQIDAVSLALMQTELFESGSEDCIAAATKAEQAADEAIGKLPASTTARLEVERLKVAAIFRGGQTGRAEAALEELVAALGQPTPPRVAALQVQIDVAKGTMEKAKDRLGAYYGQSPADAPASLEMDLARLDYLLQSGARRDVGAWLDAIEQRGGAYARRRAEAISLASLRATGRETEDDRPQMVDPSLVAAQGQDWLRRGEPGRAGELLSAAAAAESDPERAMRHASEAAAAFMAVDRPLDAAQVLGKIATANPDASTAAAAHLQSAVLISEAKVADAAKRLESLLRVNVETWPTSEVAPSARKWLIQVLQAQERYLEAAMAATAIPADEVSSQEIEAAIGLWRVAFRAATNEDWSDIAKHFRSAFEPLIDNPAFREKYFAAAALLLDRDALSTLPAGVPSDVFVDALLKFRKTSTHSDVLLTPPPGLVEDFTWRLMRDGRRHPQQRKMIATLIEHWVASSEGSIGQAERLIWLGQLDRSIQMLRQLVKDSPKSTETVKRAAELLGSTRNQKTQQAAIELWDQLANGSTRGSVVWHQAKLSAIELLGQSGKEQEAQRRAKYILLTTPNIESEWKLRYEAAGK